MRQFSKVKNLVREFRQGETSYKIVISDCHLSGGRFMDGRINPHEDFQSDDQMCDLIEHFSSGQYGEIKGRPVQVEMVIAGDFLDFLNVPYQGEFEDAITEEISLYKLEKIIEGHPQVMSALRSFASLPGKTITYLIGNHDADLFYEGVRERIVREWDATGLYPSESVRIEAGCEALRYPGGVEIRHGNQFEPGSDLDFEQPFFNSHLGKQYLKIPWGSYYVLKVVNRMKEDRPYLDKIRPIKVFVVFGLIFDTLFTLQYVFLSVYYFVRTRLAAPSRKGAGIREFWELLLEETRLFQDLERPARKLLDEDADRKTIIFGHTHRPMDRVYPDGKQYINTGTWTKMIDLDWRYMGSESARTFAYIEIRPDGTSHSELRQWLGERGPHRLFSG